MIHLLYFVRKLITALLEVLDNREKNIKGKDIPMPKDMKLIMLEKKFVANKDLANKAAINPGLHGSTTPPKNRPNINALR